MFDKVSEFGRNTRSKTLIRPLSSSIGISSLDCSFLRISEVSAQTGTALMLTSSHFSSQSSPAQKSQCKIMPVLKMRMEYNYTKTREQSIAKSTKTEKRFTFCW